MSAERIRYATASPPSGSAANQLLIGKNDVTAATALALRSETYTGSAAFAKWASAIVGNAGVPIVGLFTLEAAGGNPDYDHEVSVTYVNTTTMWYHDQANLFARSLPVSGATRAQCQCTSCVPPAYPAYPNQQATDFNYCLPNPVKYAVGLTGISDPLAETVRMTLSYAAPISPTFPGGEPDWGAEDLCYYPSAPVSVTARVYGLGAASINYGILRFDGTASLPASGFLASNTWSRLWMLDHQGVANIELPAFDTTLDSRGAYFYRCVVLPPFYVPPASVAYGGFIGRPTFKPTPSARAPTPAATLTPLASSPEQSLSARATVASS